MSLIINPSSGGGGVGSAYAYVYVTYPSGATVNCTNSIRVIEIDNCTSVFLLATNTNTCTVSMVKNYFKKSIIISNIIENNSYYIHLTPDLSIIEEGISLFNIADNWTVTNVNGDGQSFTPSESSKMTIEQSVDTGNNNCVLISKGSGRNEHNCVKFNNAIDLTPYHRMYLRFSTSRKDTNCYLYARVIANNQTDWNTNTLVSQALSGITSTSLIAMDVSSINDLSQVGFSINCGSTSTYGNIFLYDLWFSTYPWI